METESSPFHNTANATRPKQPALIRLNFLHGKWKTEGNILNENGSAAGTIVGTDTYEWVSGGRFLLHRVDVMMGETKAEVIEVIGCDHDTSQEYTMRSFDSEGNFVTMNGSFLSDGSFTIYGDGLRATLSHDPDRQTMSVHWEKAEDGSNWIRWLDMKLSREVL